MLCHYTFARDTSDDTTPAYYALLTKLFLKANNKINVPNINIYCQAVKGQF